MWRLSTAFYFVLEETMAPCVCKRVKSLIPDEMFGSPLLRCIPEGRWQNLQWKLRQQSAICCNSLGLFRDYGLNYIFLGIKLFQDRTLKLSASVRKRISWHLTKLIQLIQTIFISNFSIRCLIEFQQMAFAVPIFSEGFGSWLYFYCLFCLFFSAFFFFCYTVVSLSWNSLMLNFSVKLQI